MANNKDRIMNTVDQPISISKLTIQNRLVMPPMQTNKTQDGHVTDALVEYYRERAVGSKPGIIITEHSCVLPNACAAEKQLLIASDDMIPEHKRLVDAIHAGGCKAFVQINHAGSFGIDASVSASNVNIPLKKLTKRPRALTVEEIHSIVDAFAAAAVRAVKAGYDGVEIHCAHGYLLNEFYSPITNKRKDEYGGTLENRLPFQSCQRRIPSDFFPSEKRFCYRMNHFFERLLINDLNKISTSVQSTEYHSFTEDLQSLSQR